MECGRNIMLAVTSNHPVLYNMNSFVTMSMTGPTVLLQKHLHSQNTLEIQKTTMIILCETFQWTIVKYSMCLSSCRANVFNTKLPNPKIVGLERASYMLNIFINNTHNQPQIYQYALIKSHKQEDVAYLTEMFVLWQRLQHYSPWGWFLFFIGIQFIITTNPKVVLCMYVCFCVWVCDT